MGGSTSKMLYKLEKDDNTELYEYENLDIPTSQDLRPFLAHVNIVSRGYPSSPSVSFVNAYNCLCNAMRIDTAIPSSLALYNLVDNNVTNTLEIYRVFMDNMATLPTETEWPYVESKIAVTPPVGTSQFAYVTLRRALTSLDGIRSPLANKYPVLCAMKMTDNYVLSNPTPDEDHDTFGYAAVCIVGYNDHDQQFLLKDPYNNRFIYVPYNYVLMDGNAVDLYVLIPGGGEHTDNSPRFV